MTDTVFYPYLGSGKIYARVAGAAAGLLEIGNASALDLEVKEDKQHLKDYTKSGGGTYASVSRIDTVTAKMKLHDLNPTNVSRVIFGTASSVTGASVVDEVVTAYKNALVPLAHPNVTAVIVTDSTAATTYLLGTDYEVRPGGIFILATGAILDAASLKVDYTFASYNKVEALTSNAIILELHFDGLNDANSGKPVILDVWRAQLSPTKALSLLGDKFAELDVEAEVLKDPSKTGTGISQFFRAKFC